MKNLLSQPHVIFSVENPMHAKPGALKIDHKTAVKQLGELSKEKNVHEVQGHYGAPETSIFISNPTEHQKKLVRMLAHKTGQESHIESDGQKHQMLFSNGPQAGQIVHGEGTDFHENQPEDFYSKLPDGTTFTHRFNFEKSDQELEKNWKNYLTAGAIGLSSIMPQQAKASASEFHQLVNRLPSVVQGIESKSNFKPVVENGKHGYGNYHVKVGKFSVKGSYSSTGSGSDHNAKITGPKQETWTDEDHGHYQMAQKIHGFLSRGHGQQLLEKYTKDLQKGMRVDWKKIKKAISPPPSNPKDPILGPNKRPANTSPAYEQRLKAYLESKKKSEESSLQKMSRPRITFPKFQDITNRPDQNVKPLETERQKKLYGRSVANAEFADRPIKFDRPTRLSGSRTPINSKPELVDAYGKRVAGKFGRSVLGLSHNTPQGPKSAAIAGKLRSKFEEADERDKAKLDDYNTKVSEAKAKYNTDMEAWRAKANDLLRQDNYEETGEEYRAHMKARPKFKKPRRPTKSIKETTSLSPEAVALRGKTTDATVEHEGFHDTMARIENKYGPVASSQIVRDLIGQHHPEAIEAVDSFVRNSMGYKRNTPRYNEELITHARDLLVNPTKREKFKKFLANTMHGRVINQDNKDREAVFKDLIPKLKQGHQKAYERAKQIGLEDIRPDLVGKSEDLNKAPIEFRPDETMIVNPSPSDKKPGLLHVKTVELPNGLIYKQHTSHRGTLFHQLFHYSDESKPLAELQTHPVGDTDPSSTQDHRVIWSVVHRDHKGKGLGKQLYMAALAHGEGVGRLMSDYNISQNANRAWKDIKGPGIQVKMAPYVTHEQAQKNPQLADMAADTQHMAQITNRRQLDPRKMFPEVRIDAPKKMAASEMAKNEAADKETERIRENKKKPEAKKPHRFKAAKWTHPNGHPRCLVCGDEEPVGGMCGGFDE